MKTSNVLEPPSETKPAPPPPAPEREAESVIDTSKMSHAQREALELTEAARPATSRIFAGDMFMGRFKLDQVYPFPLQPSLDSAAGAGFLSELNRVLRD